MSVVIFNISIHRKVKTTTTIIRRLANNNNTAAAATTTTIVRQCFHSQPWCTRGRGNGQTNLVPSGFVTNISKSLARERMDRVENITVRSTHHISSSLIFSDQTLKPEPETKQPYGGGSMGEEKSDEKARSINKQIFALGRDGKWKGILTLYKEGKQHFNAVNHSIVMSQLGRIRQMRKDDPLFKTFLDDLAANFHTGGIAWIAKARTLATIVHAIAKMGLASNSSAMKIMRLADNCDTVD